jgi:two-component system, cell cycle response regulator DivK
MRKCVLVVDDDPDHREICVAILRHRGYDVLEAADGKEAIRIGREERPALILMDGKLPLLDGWKATERLKKRADTAQIPIVIFTAHVLGEDQERSEEVGADGFLAKPCEPADIVAEIERLIGPAIAPQGS